jgi:dienelactone hydrolase
MKTLTVLAFAMGAALMPRQEITTEAVDYKHGDVALQGTLAYDKASKGKKAGVILVHEWKGHGEYVKSRAQQIAKLGYVAFAIDMYGKGVFAKDHEEAGKLAGAFFKDRQLMRDRAKAALDVFVKMERVDGTKIAAMGYCFGGTTSLEMARAGFDVKMVASFHGNLTTPTPAEKGKVKAQLVAVFHGADDKFVGDVEVFKKEIGDAGVDLNFHSYAGAVHSFTVKEAGDDPSKGMAYNEKADKESWEKLTKYLGEYLK